jgi:RES domain-containing protein
LSIIVWRIAVDTPAYSATDLSGTGAKLTGGRWNRPGLALLYTSSSISLAALETVVHLKSGGLPLLRYLVRIEIPNEVWANAQALTHTSAAQGWDALPATNASMETGEAFVNRGHSALLLAPSVIVPEEANVLINPVHPDSARIRATRLRHWTYDPRLIAG